MKLSKKKRRMITITVTIFALALGVTQYFVIGNKSKAGEVMYNITGKIQPENGGDGCSVYLYVTPERTNCGRISKAIVDVQFANGSYGSQYVCSTSETAHDRNYEGINHEFNFYASSNKRDSKGITNVRLCVAANKLDSYNRIIDKYTKVSQRDYGKVTCRTDIKRVINY